MKLSKEILCYLRLFSDICRILLNITNRLMKPSTPKGTRDFSPEVMVKRNYIFDTIKNAFRNFGYAQIETPSFEHTQTLMGKYGEEGDRLIFKILRSGDITKKGSKAMQWTKIDAAATKALLASNEGANELPADKLLSSSKMLKEISEKALRYDLTVPFARYVVQHRNDITFPFKRFQMQPVWRADRPQKGRFQEFYQCDADVVGSNSLWYEVELTQLYDRVFHELGLKDVSIHINNRKILSGIAEVIGASDQLIDMTVALDKLDKIGEEKVKEEMFSKGMSEEAIAKIDPLFRLSGDNEAKMQSLKTLLANSAIGMKGIEELEFVFSKINVLGLKTAQLEFNVTLARGLNYYTGAIFEVAANGVEMGSIGGGGRYDDLTGIFGLKDVSGVGVSFGLARIYLVLEELGLFPDLTGASTQVLFVNFGDDEALHAMKLIGQLRDKGINAELYPQKAKMGKQMAYADKKGIPYVVLIGEDEMKSGILKVKDMQEGNQEALSIDDLINKL